MIPASYAVLSARTPSGGAYLAELPARRQDFLLRHGGSRVVAGHAPAFTFPFYVFLTAATFCGMAAWHRRGQALMAAAAGYTIAASYQDIHPVGSAVIFLAIFLPPLLAGPAVPRRLAGLGASALAFPLFYLSWWLFGTAHHPEATHFWDSTVALACAAPPRWRPWPCGGYRRKRF